jgi:hypothetical protein
MATTKVAVAVPRRLPRALFFEPWDATSTTVTSRMPAPVRLQVAISAFSRLSALPSQPRPLSREE